MAYASVLPVTLTHPLDLAQVIQAVRPAAEYVLAHGQLALQVAAVFVVLGQQPLGLQLLLADSQVAVPARYLQHPLHTRLDFLFGEENQQQRNTMIYQ